MAWELEGTHRAKKEAARAMRSNEKRKALKTDEVKPGHAHRAKSFGLSVFYESFRPDRPYEFVSWYASERARDNAIVAFNKKATGRFLPVIAIGKVQH